MCSREPEPYTMPDKQGTPACQTVQQEGSVLVQCFLRLKSSSDSLSCRAVRKSRGAPYELLGSCPSQNQATRQRDRSCWAGPCSRPWPRAAQLLVTPEPKAKEHSTEMFCSQSSFILTRGFKVAVRVTFYGYL